MKQYFSTSVFGFASDFITKLDVIRSRMAFTKSLNKMISATMYSYNGYCADRAFEDFKEKFDDQRKAYEANPEKLKNLGFENFTQMMEVVVGDMDIFSHVGRNAGFIDAITSAAHELRDVWNDLPHDHQVIIDREGVLFCEINDMIASDFVYGIHNACHPFQTPDSICDMYRQRQTTMIVTNNLKSKPKQSAP